IDIICQLTRKRIGDGDVLNANERPRFKDAQTTTVAASIHIQTRIVVDGVFWGPIRNWTDIPAPPIVIFPATIQSSGKIPHMSEISSQKNGCSEIAINLEIIPKADSITRRGIPDKLFVIQFVVASIIIDIFSLKLARAHAIPGSFFGFMFLPDSEQVVIPNRVYCVARKPIIGEVGYFACPRFSQDGVFADISKKSSYFISIKGEVERRGPSKILIVTEHICIHGELEPTVFQFPQV